MTNPTISIRLRMPMRKVKIELYPTLESTRYRVFINRRWYKSELSREQVGIMLSQLVQGAEVPKSPPVIPIGTRVLAPNGHFTSDGKNFYDKTWIQSEPIQRYDGKWCIGVTIVGRKGIVLIPIDEIKIL